ncbi:T6SS immunity protein Tli3 family protein [Burkholderia ubonensis]|uniref:T6SS immunity protein Tli3 family protein n=1 Tax=Burkholderia ubonensis TaxID=101571 RepID=UPI000ACFD248|nr:hypothetical protein [Burkholderia ubonensis]
MIRYFSLAVSALSLVLLTACSLLIPPGIPSGMTNPAARGTPISSYPERLVYRIDDHRYITIQGNRNCVGMVWYYDTRLGVRTDVAATGLTLGNGVFHGYYAVNSEYVVIPVIEFSQMSGPLLYIYYSRDGGRTFKSFLWGVNIADSGVVVLDGKSLYVGRMSSNPRTGLYLANLYDVSHDIAIGDDQRAVKPDGQRIDPHLVPLSIKSPSGLNKWTCPASVELM